MGERSEEVLDRTRRLLTFLAATARELTVRPVRDVLRPDLSGGPAALLPTDVPKHPKVRLGTPADWLEVRKVPCRPSRPASPVTWPPTSPHTSVNRLSPQGHRPNWNCPSAPGCRRPGAPGPKARPTASSS